MPLTQSRKTGLKGPDREATRTRELATRRLRGAAYPAVFLQPIARVRDQPALPDCVGEGPAGRIHGLTGFDPSSRGIWRGAQLRGAGYFDPGAGALLEWAVEELMRRGFTHYVTGEEYDTSNTSETWGEGVEAFDYRQLGTDHYRIDVGDLPALFTALTSGMVVFDGGGVTEKFMQRGPARSNDPAGIDELGGDENGHCQGIVGYWLGSPMGDVVLYQGSWSEGFAGCYLPELSAAGEPTGRWSHAPGCFWAKAETFSHRWDCQAIRVAV